MVSDLCYEGFGGGGRAPAGGDPARPDRRPVPLLVTGGGGYTPPLVARCWALETAVLLGRELGEVMPRAAAEAPDLRDLGPPYFRWGWGTRGARGNAFGRVTRALLPACEEGVR